MRLLSEFGIIGTVLYLGFVASIWLGLVRVLRRCRDPQLRRFAFAALISLSAYMITRVASVGLFTEIYFWMMFAMGVAVIRLYDFERKSRRESTIKESISPRPSSQLTDGPSGDASGE